MKKLFCIIMVCSVLLLAACTGGDKPLPTAAPEGSAEPTAGQTANPTEAPEARVPDFSCDPATDFDKRLSQQYSRSCFADAGDVFYWYTDNDRYIRWCEKDGGEWGVLCPYPECEHDAGNANHVNNDCAGHIGFQPPNIFLYEGKLYYLWTYTPDETSFGKLYRMDPDGMNRELYAQLPPLLTDEGKPFYSGTVYMHRGLVFIRTQRQDIEDAEPVYRDTVAVIPLGGSEFKTIYTPDYSEHRYHYIMLSFAGEFCYIFDNHGDTATISRWSSVTEELELLYDGEELMWVFYGWITDTGELYAASVGEMDKGREMVMRLENGEWKEVVRFEDGEKQWTILTVSDGVAIARNFIPYDPDDPADYSKRSTDTDIDIWVMTYGGETLYKGKLPMDWMDELDPGATFENIDLVFGDENGFVMQFELRYRNRERSDEPVVQALLRYDFTEEGIACTLLARNYSKIVLEW